MNLETQILKVHSKENALRIARWVGDDAKRFAELMGLFLKGEYRVTQRSAWIVSMCAEWHPKLIAPWLKPMLKKMREPGVHDAVPRNVVRVLQFVEIPRALMGEVADDCFKFLGNERAPIAVRVFSMTVLARIAQHEPDLKKEIELVIQELLPYGGAAIKARAKHVMNTLKKIS